MENGEILQQNFSQLGLETTFVKKTTSPNAITYFFNLTNISDYDEKRIDKLITQIAVFNHLDLFFKKTKEAHFAVVMNIPQQKISLYKLIYPSFEKVVIGIDESNNKVEIDFDKCAHLLIAGTTGSGKSVLLHNLLINIYGHYAHHKFDKAEIIIIDPKGNELNHYKDCVNTCFIDDTKQAIETLKKCCVEMDKRYKEPGYEYRDLFIVIDELADLMLTSRYEVEESIVRLAQKGRACNIHLIVATQRPTVDVVSGLIKANITTRIALKVASMRDSMNILDHKAAETLRGYGDALIKYPTLVNEIRFQVALPEKEFENAIIDINKRRLG